jgi:flagellar motor component MotA
MSIFEFHYIGGMPFMVLLTLTLLANTAVIVYAFVKRETLNQKWLGVIKHIAGFALAWGAFSTLVGLYDAFADLERMTEMLPFNVIMGGLKVALITTLYGFGIFLYSHLCLIVLKLTKKETV